MDSIEHITPRVPVKLGAPQRSDARVGVPVVAVSGRLRKAPMNRHPKIVAGQAESQLLSKSLIAAP